MDSTRDKNERRIFACFRGESEWVEYQLLYNQGGGGGKSLKFQALRRWASPGAPALFAGFRGSFSSVREADTSIVDQLVREGAIVHSSSPALLSRLRKEFGYPCA